jgi:hypothetical protein
MNNYDSLKEEITDTEIKTDTELRKIKKKLRHSKQKGNDIAAHKFQILIDEYENHSVEKPQHEKKKKEKKKNAALKKKNQIESDIFLEQEYCKNKEKNAKKQVEENRRKQAEERRKQQEKQRREEQRREDKRRVEEQLFTLGTYKIIEDHGLDKKTLPRDILPILSNYSNKLWRDLSMKYHPDKYNGSDIYSKLINALKHFHNESK